MKKIEMERNMIIEDNRKEKKLETSVELKSVREIIDEIKDETILPKLVVDGEDISRDFCWEVERAEEFIKSVITNTDVKVHLYFIDKGITFEELNDMDFDMDEVDDTDKYQIETIDGKQRMKAMLDFYEDKIMVDGKYFSEHTKEAQNEFLDYVFMLLTLSTRDNERIKKIYALTRGM